MTDLTIPRSLDVQGRPRRAPLFILVHWLPPHVGWIKLNTDDMAQGALVRYDWGVFCDHGGGGGLSFDYIVLILRLV